MPSDIPVVQREGTGLSLEVFQIPAFQDNYLWVLRSGGETAVVDPGDAHAVVQFLEKRQWQLDYIWNTHHHMDHVGGNLALKSKYGCEIIGPGTDRTRIPGIDRGAHEGEMIRMGDAVAEVIFTPGHTRGHICYLFQDELKAFVGDTLFALGCGRLFEGTAEQMFASFAKIKQWPPATEIFCAHEYTEANGRFALSLESADDILRHRMEAITLARRASRPTVPFTLAEDLQTNPFFLAADADEFRRIRKQKDCFC